MGRELKRVPLTFDAPLDEIWPGYLRTCGDPECEDESCGECARIDPPTGDGYQMWETTTEGSPQSPVFPTLDALAVWCAEHATTFADFRATAEQWRAMLVADNVRHETQRADGSTIIFM